MSVCFYRHIYILSLSFVVGSVPLNGSLVSAREIEEKKKYYIARSEGVYLNTTAVVVSRCYHILAEKLANRRSCCFNGETLAREVWSRVFSSVGVVAECPLRAALLLSEEREAAASRTTRLNEDEPRSYGGKPASSYHRIRRDEVKSS